MSFLAVVSGIFSIAKAVPVVADYIDRFYNIWVDKKIETIDAKYNLIYKKRKAVLSSIQKATNDEERKVLSIILADIS